VNCKTEEGEMEMAWVGSVEEESEELQLERLSISGSRTGDVISLV